LARLVNTVLKEVASLGKLGHDVGKIADSKSLNKVKSKITVLAKVHGSVFSNTELLYALFILFMLNLLYSDLSTC
jgi:hypothetical protein